MRAKIEKIGNSHFIRIPKRLLRKTGLGEDVEIKVDGDRLIITPLNYQPRAGWAEAFDKIARNKEDAPLDEYVPTQFDKDEWEW